MVTLLDDLTTDSGLGPYMKATVISLLTSNFRFVFLRGLDVHRFEISHSRLEVEAVSEHPPIWQLQRMLLTC